MALPTLQLASLTLPLGKCLTSSVRQGSDMAPRLVCVPMIRCEAREPQGYSCEHEALAMGKVRVGCTRHMIAQDTMSAPDRPVPTFTGCSLVFVATLR